ncbi:MAG: ABC transporter permease subunit [Clostridiales bacterium]|nr:ABC transporter permease subunit [Clostridiales bacterium]
MDQQNAKPKRSLLRIVLRNYQVYLLLLPCIIYFALFCYGPMYGLQIAFKNYNTGLGILGSEWAGLKWFQQFLSSGVFWGIFKNTLVLSVYTIIVGFPLPIILALMLNEVRSLRFKKITQTISYAPHFISTVVIVSMITLFLSPSSGVINKIIEAFGGDAVYFMIKPKLFQHIYAFSGIWQHVGWSSIIYLAALTGIDPTLYEAAQMDGASRMRCIWHINLPSLRPVIVISLILSAGGVLGGDFEKILLMQNASIMETADVISTYVYRLGIGMSQFSLSSAIGVFNSVINFIVLLLVNKICRKVGDTSLW